jgi:hypothetical protein
VQLGVSKNSLRATLHLPVPEFTTAFVQPVPRNAAEITPAFRANFDRYLQNHLNIQSPSGQPWRVALTGLTVQDGETTPAGPVPELLVHLEAAPPPAAPLREFTLHYSLILHQVVTHKAIVSVKSDWETGRTEPNELGVIAVNTHTSRIEPFRVRLSEGSLWTGFAAMFLHGIRHISEGTDHLLFLLVLLLPATLKNEPHRWGTFAGGRASLMRLLAITAAFAAGHSITLLAGALRWVELPAQPVEVCIAFSIFITAIHAIRPLFPDREVLVAAGFGLIHGLAFATVLADLDLAPLPMALSILGFNLGIEATQILAVAVTMPWLVLLSQTPAHRYVRVSGAFCAAAASLAWMASRVTGASNPLERILERLAPHSPLVVLALASIAIPSYFFTQTKTAPRTLPRTL